MSINRIGARILTAVLSAVLVMTSFVFITVEPVHATNSQVILGQAASGESGLSGQVAGDQTTKEVHTFNWGYQKSKSGCYHWTVVARANDPEVAKKIAQVMRDACENDCVGYDRNDGERLTFYNALVEANYDATKICYNVETTCTPLIAACINAAGIAIKPDSSASGLASRLKKNSAFTIYKKKAYVKSDANLQAGDILLATGSHQHGAVVISSPNSPDLNASSRATKGPFKAGKQYILNVDLNVRTGPGTSNDIISYNSLSSASKKYSVSKETATFRAGTIITCTSKKGNWINTENGWICGKYKLQYHVQEYRGTKDQKALAKKAAKKAAAKIKLVVGNKYVLTDAVYVRKGPGKQYKPYKRSKLTSYQKKHSYKTKYARLKKGTTVTCYEISGNWIRIDTGWIYTRGYAKAA